MSTLTDYEDKLRGMTPEELAAECLVRYRLYRRAGRSARDRDQHIRCCPAECERRNRLTIWNEAVEQVLKEEREAAEENAARTPRREA
jgi:hypothetical protein